MKTNDSLPTATLAAFLALTCCGTPANASAPPQSASDIRAASQPAATSAKSAKRGVAYDFANPSDLAALATGVSWWYNWGSTLNSGIPSNYLAAYGVDYYPMLWDGNFDKSTVESFLRAHSEIKYLLVLNEPNVSGQAKCGSNQPYCSPTDAAALWPQYETVAADTGTQLVGPQITYGTEPNYTDPIAWLAAAPRASTTSAFTGMTTASTPSSPASPNTANPSGSPSSPTGTAAATARRLTPSPSRKPR